MIFTFKFYPKFSSLNLEKPIILHISEKQYFRCQALRVYFLFPFIDLRCLEVLALGTDSVDSTRNCSVYSARMDVFSTFGNDRSAFSQALQKSSQKLFSPLDTLHTLALTASLTLPAGRRNTASMHDVIFSVLVILFSLSFLSSQSLWCNTDF